MFKIAPLKNAVSHLLPEKIHLQNCKKYIFKKHFLKIHFQNCSLKKCVFKIASSENAFSKLLSQIVKNKFSKLLA